MLIGLCLVLVNGYSHPNAHIEHDPTSIDFDFFKNNNDRNTIKKNILIKQNVNNIKPNLILPIEVEFNLIAISQIGNKFRANINNQWLEKGQVFSSIKIKEIKSNRVIVIKGNKIHELSIRKNSSVFNLNTLEVEVKQTVKQESTQEVIGEKYE